MFCNTGRYFRFREFLDVGKVEKPVSKTPGPVTDADYIEVQYDMRTCELCQLRVDTATWPVCLRLRRQIRSADTENINSCAHSANGIGAAVTTRYSSHDGRCQHSLKHLILVHFILERANCFARLRNWFILHKKITWHSLALLAEFNGTREPFNLNQNHNQFQRSHE